MGRAWQWKYSVPLASWPELNSSVTMTFQQELPYHRLRSTDPAYYTLKLWAKRNLSSHFLWYFVTATKSQTRTQPRFQRHWTESERQLVYTRVAGSSSFSLIYPWNMKIQQCHLCACGILNVLLLGQLSHWITANYISLHLIHWAFFVLFCSAGDGSQPFMHAREVF
jgi:hypothetical protein